MSITRSQIARQLLSIGGMTDDNLKSLGLGSLGAPLVDIAPTGVGSLGGMEEEDEFADIKGQTAGLGIFGPISKGLQSIFGSKLGAAIFENSVRRPAIEKGIQATKKANEKAYQARKALEERLARAAALKAAQEEINRMGYIDYGSGGADTFDTTNIDDAGNYQDDLDPGQTE